MSASTARFLYPDADAVGRGPRFAAERFGITRETTVQGVVADMKYAGLEAGPAASIYVPWRHRPMGWPTWWCAPPATRRGSCRRCAT